MLLMPIDRIKYPAFTGYLVCGCVCVCVCVCTYTYARLSACVCARACAF